MGQALARAAWTSTMAKWVAVAAVLVAVTGCTRMVDNPQAKPDSSVIGPITALQVHDLLSGNVGTGDGNLFGSVEPDRCSGLAREVDPPFIVSRGPVVKDGGHWQTPDGDVYIEEIVAVYPANFDPAGALGAAREAIESCRSTQLTVTTIENDTYVFDAAQQDNSGPDGSVLWSLRGTDWHCDNALVAAHNAAIEITACGRTGGFDVASAAKDALERIDKLANTTA